ACPAGTSDSGDTTSERSDVELDVVLDHRAGVDAGEQVGDLALAGEDSPRVDLVPRNENECSLVRARVGQRELGIVADSVADHDEVDVEGSRRVSVSALAAEGSLDRLRPLEQHRDREGRVGEDD